ncbi:MAG: hypothetical protein K1Y01_17545 [Vicinamibacteria bacterium]|nr:hypothetical protein [Vicinamibacteria bacterium]
MAILLNLIAAIAVLVAWHSLAAGAWYGVTDQYLKRRLLNAGIIGPVSRSVIDKEARAHFVSAVSPLAFLVAVMALWGSARTFLVSSWGLLLAAFLGLIEIAVLAWAWRDMCSERRAEIYGEYKGSILSPLAAWQKAILDPYVGASATESIKAIIEKERAKRAAFAANPPEGVRIAVPEGRDPDLIPQWEFVISKRVVGPDDWTTYACETLDEPRARFSFVERGSPAQGDPPIAWGEARVSFPDADNAIQFARGMLHAFWAGDPPSEVAPPQAPVEFATVVFSREATELPSGGFASKGGTWVASKWTTEEDAEIFVNWNVAESRGYFSEKDQTYAAGICRAFGVAVEDEDFDDGES